MRRPALWMFAAMALAGCDASGNTQGGTPLETTSSCSPSNLSPTWTNLYNCYFGPSGKASCTGQGYCHVAPSVPDAAHMFGSFWWVCGATRESCWQGLWNAQMVCQDVTMDAACEAGPDASSDSGPVDATTEASVEGGIDASPDGGGCSVSVCEAQSSDPTISYLYLALRQSGLGETPVAHNMPCRLQGGTCLGPGGYTFTQPDLDLISAWIRAGAQDN